MCKCLVIKDDIIAFAVHDLDVGKTISSNTLVVMRRKSLDNDDRKGAESESDARSEYDIM